MIRVTIVSSISCLSRNHTPMPLSRLRPTKPVSSTLRMHSSWDNYLKHPNKWDSNAMSILHPTHGTLYGSYLNFSTFSPGLHWLWWLLLLVWELVLFSSSFRLRCSWSSIISTLPLGCCLRRSRYLWLMLAAWNTSTTLLTRVVFKDLVWNLWFLQTISSRSSISTSISCVPSIL